MGTGSINAPPRNDVYGMRPRYLRYNLWDPKSDFTPTTAEWSETATPLPSTPASEIANPVVAKTIRDHPELFKIVTPIKVDIFESYLATHPNQPFVASVCRGLREGFWPWANTLLDGYPETHDVSKPSTHRLAEETFMSNQLNIELGKGRFSESFGKDLLPGMYSMPIYAVPKPNSTDFRLITDQSFSKYSLNSMIDHNCVTGYPLDNLTHLGERLMDTERRNPGVPLEMWKADISEAYRLMPMAYEWQIKQVNTIGGLRYVDHNNAFGGCASGAIFIAFNSLVAWIAKYIFFVSLLNYVDDSSGCSLAGDHEFYEPYRRVFPRPQAILLRLWDELGIPHKEKKQLFGAPLMIIGINVDPIGMSFTLSDISKERLLEELRMWCRKGGKEKLKRWFQLGGWYNWALNAYPLLRPGLNQFYSKIGGKSESNLYLFINNEIRSDFTWAIRKLENSSGIYLLKSLKWDVRDASHIIYCDACPLGMGFWYPEFEIGFYSPTPADINPRLIFYFEALCVLSALLDAHRRSRIESRFVIYTDNFNTVSMYNTLRALPAYNHLLKASVNIITDGDHQLRVLHVPGVDNQVADALSRLDFSRALDLIPGLRIYSFEPFEWLGKGQNHLFQPPRGTLGAELK